MKFNFFYITLMTLLLFSCEKKQESYQYKNIDLIELSTNFGMSREEINKKYTGCLIGEYRDFTTIEDFSIKTESGNYTLRIFYDCLLNENNEPEYPSILLTFKMSGEISTISRAASIRQLEDIIHNNFEKLSYKSNDQSSNPVKLFSFALFF